MSVKTSILLTEQEKKAAEITFFKHTQKNATFFINSEVVNTPNISTSRVYGTTQTIEITKSADMLRGVIIACQLPALQNDHVYMQNIMAALVQKISFNIGATKVDELTGDQIYRLRGSHAARSNCIETFEKHQGIYTSPKSSIGYTLYSDLPFFFSTHASNALSMQSQQMYSITVTFANAARCVRHQYMHSVTLSYANFKLFVDTLIRKNKYASTSDSQVYALLQGMLASDGTTNAQIQQHIQTYYMHIDLPDKLSIICNLILNNKIILDIEAPLLYEDPIQSITEPSVSYHSSVTHLTQKEKAIQISKTNTWYIPTHVSHTQNVTLTHQQSADALEIEVNLRGWMGYKIKDMSIHSYINQESSINDFDDEIYTDSRVIEDMGPYDAYDYSPFESVQFFLGDSEELINIQPAYYFQSAHAIRINKTPYGQQMTLSFALQDDDYSQPSGYLDFSSLANPKLLVKLKQAVSQHVLPVGTLQLSRTLVVHATALKQIEQTPATGGLQIAII